MTLDQIVTLVFVACSLAPIIGFIIMVYTLRWHRKFRLKQAYRKEILEAEKFGYSPLMIMLHLKHPVDHQGRSIWIGDILPGRRIEDAAVQQALTRIYRLCLDIN